MAEQLISSMVVPWDPSAFHDVYRERVEALIQQKETGAVVSTEARQGAPSSTCLAALEASVRARRGEGAKDRPTRAERRAPPIGRGPSGRLKNNGTTSSAP